MIEHIAVHRYYMGILEEFPDRTASDLYLWVSDHLHYLREQQGREDADPAEAAAEFIEGLQQE